MTLTAAPGLATAGAEQQRVYRVLLIDPQRIFREALQLLFERQAEFAVLGGADQPCEALALIAALKPDIVVTELQLGASSSTRHIEEIRAHHPQTAVLVLTALRAHDVAARVRRAGALGYLLKDQDRSELWTALREVAAGRWYQGAARRAPRVRSRRGYDDSSARAALLTERQRQVLRSVALGYRTREIAQMLGVSVKAVYRQRERLRHALQLDSTAALTRFAAREGLIER
jgi:DNA-binding NarL/FixJ family response regulator